MASKNRLQKKLQARPKVDDKFCVRCGRDARSAIYCNHLHRCLGRVLRGLKT
jgi:hypothetical protein